MQHIRSSLHLMNCCKLNDMKKILILIMALVLGTVAASAQDIITKRNGEDIRAVVSEVGPDTITYKLYDDPQEVSYTIMKSDVVMIRYESGRNEIIETGRSSFDPLLYGTRIPVEGIKPGMKYREIRKLYDPKMYVRGLVQNHNPGWSGVASYFIPGLGQMICGEVGRGFAFLGGSAVSFSLLVTGSAMDADSGVLIGFVGLAGYLTSCIWSIVDAVQVAKVKNMYEQDLYRSYSFNMDMYPSVQCINTPSGLKPAAGMTLAFRF